MQDQYGSDFAVIDLLIDATSQSELTNWESSNMAGSKLSGRPAGFHYKKFLPAKEIGIPYFILIDGTTMEIKSVGNSNVGGLIAGLLGS